MRPTRTAAEPGTATVAENDDALTELKTLNARFIHNFVTNDVGSHDAMLHPRFISMTPSGARVSRQDYLRRWATGFDPGVIVYWDVRDELITIFDDVALVRATNKATIRQGGTERTGMSTYTDTYLRENGEWKCIQAQITTVAPEHYPGDETIVSVYIKGQLQK
jgi:ketosteroid isomerase-like protein